MKDFKVTKTVKYGLISVAAIIIAAVFLYRIVLPAVVSSKLFINTAKNIVFKITGAELNLVNPKIKTSIRPRLDISFDNLSLKKNNEDILDIKDFKTDFSYRIITSKSLKFRKLTVDSIFIDLDKLSALIPAAK